jgi:ribosomal L7/L12-like protein
MSTGTAFVLGFLLGVVLMLVVFLSVRRRPLPPVVLPELDEETLSRARDLVARGEIVHAVKVVRAETGLGLVHAKAVVDQLPRTTGKDDLGDAS